MDLIDTATFVSTGLGAFIGSMLTLAATLLAHSLAKRDQEKKERSLIHGFLQGIHDEIETLWDSYMEGIGKHIETLKEGEPLNMFWPVTQEYFTVYNNNAFLIGRIEDHDLRKEIVSTYSNARGLIDSFRLNNDLVQKHETAFWISQETKNPVHEANAKSTMSTLSRYSAAIKPRHERMREQVARLLRALRKKGVLSNQP